MAEPYCPGPASARIRGIHSSYHMPSACPDIHVKENKCKLCGSCVNNCGGGCCYDIDLEEKEDGVDAGTYCDKNHCVFYESYRHHLREHSGYDDEDEPEDDY